MINGPLVSVVIPCLNQGEYLRAALRSVAAQTHGHRETIVVDDGSTDNTALVAEQGGATVVRQRHAGLGAARNAGLRASRGRYVIILDADDELIADAMESGVAVLDRNQHACMVARCCMLIDAVGRPLPTLCPEPATGDLYGEWLVRNFVWTPGAAMFRREPLAALGGFPADVGPAADYAVYLELARAGCVVFDRREVVRYRQHDSNMSRDAARMLAATLAVLRRERSRVPPRYQAQYRRGLHAWRTFYGEEIIQQLRSAVRRGHVGRRELAGVSLLLRECRGLVMTHMRRKLARIIRGLPSTPVEPGRFPPVPPANSGSMASFDGPG
jgi:glycosyltransferase involved in cell wall biosynthesis